MDWKHFFMALIEEPERLIKNAETQKFELNQEYMEWQRQDNFLASWLLSSLTEGILTLMVGMSGSKEIWNTLAANFATQSRAKIMQHKLQLQTMKKGGLSMIEYLNKMRSSFDILGSVGYKLLEEDKIMHVLTGLGSDYDPIVVTITSKYEDWSFMDVQSILLSYEARLEANSLSLINNDGSGPSVNAAVQSNQYGRAPSNNSYRGRSSFGGRRGRGARSGNFRGRGNRSGGARFQCQLCNGNHTADRCWYRFDASYSGPNNGANAVAPQAPNRSPNLNVAQLSSHSVTDAASEGLWYPDSGATHLVSNELSNLNLASDYHGFSKVQMGNGAGPSFQDGSSGREA